MNNMVNMYCPECGIEVTSQKGTYVICGLCDIPLKELIVDNNMIGKKVIVRADRAGVFFGTLKEKEGQEVTLTNCRRIWYWDGAASITQLAVDGTTKPVNCKFTITVAEIVIMGVIEIIPCSEKAIASIEGVAEWRK